MMQSSIRFSFVGEHVGWTTKMSRARTFCSISTSTSPSEKRATFALPRPIDRCVAISCARAGFALPVNRTVLNSTAALVALADLAGEEGLEPSHVGIKIRCLDQLGDSPTPVHGLRRAPRPSRRAQPLRGWRSSERHIRLDQPDGQSLVISTDGAEPAFADPARA